MTILLNKPANRSLLSITEKATEIGVTIETLRQWRRANRGPVWVKYGETIRYWPEEKPTCGASA